MNKETKKHPVDTTIEKLDEVDKKLGLPQSKKGKRTITIIFNPSENNPLVKYLKEKHKNKNSGIE